MHALENTLGVQGGSNNQPPHPLPHIGQRLRSFCNFIGQKGTILQFMTYLLSIEVKWAEKKISNY